MITNSPSGTRLAVGRSMTPGNPKLPTVTRRVSLAAGKGKNNVVQIMMSDAEVIIDLLVCRHINRFTFKFHESLVFSWNTSVPTY